MASWYGPGFHGQAAANGETYDQDAMTAAMPTLPIPSLVQVTNLANGREVILRVTDRGPFVDNRIIDVSHRAAEVLGFDQTGTARVHVRYLGPAPKHYAEGRDSDAPTPAAYTPPMNAPTLAPIVMAAPHSDGPVSLLPPAAATDAAAPTPDQTQAPRVQNVSWVQPQPQPLSAAHGGFVVQVGAFSDPATAQRVQAAVHSAGAASVDTRASASGAQLYRVRLGSFATREQAEAARSAVASLGYPEAIVAH
jgi:rare lipoprotein A